jgi:hypothetical protein
MADVLLRIERAEHAQPDQDPHRVSQSQLQLVGARARSEAIAAEHDDRLRWDVTAMVGIPTD